MRHLDVRAAVSAGILPILLSACGGGGTDSGAAAAGAPAPPAVVRVATVDAVRLAQQATFGPTSDLIAHISAGDIGSWLDEQFAATGSTYSDLAALVVSGDYCAVNAPNDNGICYQRYFTSRLVAMRFYSDAIAQPDQLRQRVAFALSQLLVTSTVDVPSTSGVAAYNQIFLNNAFGNYRDILKAITLNSYMGNYLDMADSSARAPSENYAREFLQLFTMGPDRLNSDGTVVLDSSGAAVANYGAADIKAIARALTGWTYARINGGPITDYNIVDYSQPMVVHPNAYDTGQKDFLGTTIPAGTAQAASVDAVVDAAFNNASTPPHVAKFLIQQLVTSNPSAAYVGRVAAAFVNNGAGVRGDLKAVVRAILIDAEARGAMRGDTAAGKVKEPALVLTSLARAIGMTTDGYAFTVRDTGLGQKPFSAPSVFNFFPPDYPLAQNASLVSPASKLLSTGAIVQRHNLVWDWTIGAEGTRPEFAAQSSIAGSTGSSLGWANWQTVGADVDGLLDRVNTVLLANAMTPAQRSALRAALLAVTNADPQIQARKRAELAFYVVATSPQFQVDR